MILTEKDEELHNRIRGFSVDDEILLGDDEIYKVRLRFDVSRKRINGGFEHLRRSDGFEERFVRLEELQVFKRLSKRSF